MKEMEMRSWLIADWLCIFLRGALQSRLDDYKIVKNIFDSSFYHYMCQPVPWEEFDQERWEELIGMPDVSWEEVWADVEKNAYPRLKWEEENLFSQTVTVMVKQGDSLSKIAQRLLKDGNRWMEIYQDNRAVIGEDPNMICQGMEFDILQK